MIEFKKYSSIENSFYTEYLDSVREQVPSDMQWVVQEKVHGTNTSFLCDGQEVKLAKRTSILEDNEKFYEYQELLEEYRERVLSMFRRVWLHFERVESIAIFGEMFGGSYPHPDVQRIGRLTMIQKGVYYTPKHEFYGFDIYVFTKDGGYYLSVEHTEILFGSEGFFYAKPLFKGTLDECLTYPNEFQTKIPEWLGYPAIDDNICEGIVIRPATPQYLRTGSRALIKSKNARFAENKSVKKRVRQIEEPVEYSKELSFLVSEVDSYVNENRLANVVSHIGEVQMPADFGKVIREMSYDVVEDLRKCHPDLYDALDKSEIKIFNKVLNKTISSLLNKTYMSS